MRIFNFFLILFALTGLHLTQRIDNTTATPSDSTRNTTRPSDSDNPDRIDSTPEVISVGSIPDNFTSSNSSGTLVPPLIYSGNTTNSGIYQRNLIPESFFFDDNGGRTAKSVLILQDNARNFVGCRDGKVQINDRVFNTENSWIVIKAAEANNNYTILLKSKNNGNYLGVNNDNRIDCSGSIPTNKINQFEVFNESLNNKPAFVLKIKGLFVKLEKDALSLVSNVDDATKFTEGNFTKIEQPSARPNLPLAITNPKDNAKKLIDNKIISEEYFVDANGNSSGDKTYLVLRTRENKFIGCVNKQFNVHNTFNNAQDLWIPVLLPNANVGADSTQNFVLLYSNACQSLIRVISDATNSNVVNVDQTSFEESEINKFAVVGVDQGILFKIYYNFYLNVDNNNRMSLIDTIGNSNTFVPKDRVLQ